MAKVVERFTEELDAYLTLLLGPSVRAARPPAGVVGAREV